MTYWGTRAKVVARLQPPDVRTLTTGGTLKSARQLNVNLQLNASLWLSMVLWLNTT